MFELDFVAFLILFVVFLLITRILGWISFNIGKYDHAKRGPLADTHWLVRFKHWRLFVFSLLAVSSCLTVKVGLIFLAGQFDIMRAIFICVLLIAIADIPFVMARRYLNGHYASGNKAQA